MGGTTLPCCGASQSRARLLSGWRISRAWLRYQMLTSLDLLEAWEPCRKGFGFIERFHLSWG